jgi:hypothetical protein
MSGLFQRPLIAPNLASSSASKSQYQHSSSGFSLVNDDDRVKALTTARSAVLISSFLAPAFVPIEASKRGDIPRVAKIPNRETNEILFWTLGLAVLQPIRHSVTASLFDDPNPSLTRISCVRNKLLASKARRLPMHVRPNRILFGEINK